MTWCPTPGFSGQHVYAGHKRTAGVDRANWWGSLIHNKRDATGHLYMRNRYYDPNSGRFTQEDPIGIAGGLNVYGFAGGDPIHYSDPYGLSSCRKWLAVMGLCALADANVSRVVGHASEAQEATAKQSQSVASQTRRVLEEQGRNAARARTASPVSPVSSPGQVGTPTSSNAARAGAAIVRMSTAAALFIGLAIDHLADPPDLHAPTPRQPERSVVETFEFAREEAPPVLTCACETEKP